MGSGGQSSDTVVLRARLDGRLIAEIRAGELPVERQVAAEARPTSKLLFTDAAGQSREFELSSVVTDQRNWLHLSVRVSGDLIAQVDFLLGSSDKPPVQEFAAGTAEGVRLQPWLLPGCRWNPAEVVGHGLFARGLHYPGLITPGNVSLLCLCDRCKGTFRLQSFHAGFSQLIYFYCSNGPHTLVASQHRQGAPALLSPPDTTAVMEFEATLPRCSVCGGEFKYLNPLRCPKCRQPYVDFARFPADRKAEYYGNHIYGDDLQHLK